MISIITSLYRSEEYLPSFLEAVQSVHRSLKEEIIPFEHIIVANDYSEKEKELIEKSGLTLRVISVPRESLYASWNRGVCASDGDVIGFWNVDDKRFADAIIEARNTLEQGEGDLIYSPFKYKRYFSLLAWSIPITVTIQPPAFTRNKFMTEMHCGPFFMFTKSLYDSIGPFDESFKIAGDYEWCSRAAAAGKFVLGTKCAGIFVNKGTGLSTSKSALHQEENARVLERAKHL